MSRRRCPERLAAALLSAALLGQAGAQTTPAPPLDPAALCAPGPELLDVTVAGQFRGTLEVRRGGGATLVDAAALTSSEARYGVQTVTCDGTPLVRLSPELNVTYDPRALSLTVAARPELLPGGELDLARVGPQGQPAAPAFGAAYSATLTWGGLFGGGGAGPSGALVLDAFAARGRVSGVAGVGLVRRDGTLGVRPHALLTYDAAPGWQLAAAWGGAPFSAPGTLQGRDFRGVAVRAGNTGRRLDRLNLNLPLDARVTVSVDGVPLTTVDARAGELLLRNLPIGVGTSNVVVEIEDATGRRTVGRLADAVRADLAPGAYLLNGEVGWEDGGPLVRGEASLGLRGDWTLSADGTWTGGAPTGGVGATRALPGGRLALGLRAAPALSVTGGLSRDLGRATVAGDVSVPLAAPGELSFGVSAAYALGDGLLYARASATPAQGRWAASAGGYARVRDLLLGAALNAGPGRAGVGLSLGWVPRDNLRVGAAAALGGGQASGTLSALYRPAPGHTLEARAVVPDLGGSALAYTYERQLYARAEVAPGGVNAAVAGAVTLVGGRLVAGREVGARALLIRTGVPGLPLRVDGAPGAVTDARGDALVALNAAARRVSVSVLPDELPINVTVREETASFGVQGNGVLTLDWRGNFAVSRWVRLFWKPGEPAAAADLHLIGGPVLPADPDGYVLLPPGAPGAGTLQSQDGARSCPVTLGTGETATCAP